MKVAVIGGSSEQPAHFKALDKEFDELTQTICIEADYVIFLNDGSELIDRFIKAYRNTGKHGSVINI